MPQDPTILPAIVNRNVSRFRCPPEELRMIENGIEIARQKWMEQKAAREVMEATLKAKEARDVSKAVEARQIRQAKRDVKGRHQTSRGSLLLSEVTDGLEEQSARKRRFSM
jgi:hypothetical protein